MAIVSNGYAGTVSDAAWAKMGRYHGSRYAVLDRGSFSCSRIGTTKTFQITGGEAYAAGVLVTSDANETIAPTVPASGGRWFLICLRRVWSALGGTSSLIVHNGPTTTITEPSTAPTSMGFITSNPGAADDQPLHWVWVNATNTTVLVIDVRDLPASTPRRGSTAERDAYYGALNIASTAGRRYLQDVRADWLDLATGERMVWLEGYQESSNPSGARGGPGWFYDAAAVMRLSRRLTRASVPSANTTLYFLADDGTIADRLTGLGAPGITYDGATGTFAITTPGEWRITVTGWVDNANTTEGRFHATNPDGGGSPGVTGYATLLGGAVVTTGQQASFAWLGIATPALPHRFKIEGLHVSGATRTLRARVDIERIRP